MRSVFSTLFGRWQQQRFGARCHCRSNLSLTAARLSGLLPLAFPRPYPLFFSLFLLSCSLLSFHPALCLPFIDSLVSLSRSSKLTPSHTMLFRKYSVHIGMKVSNRCSIIAVVSLYPSCYPRRNCYFGRKCCVSLVVIWFCADWQSVVMPVSSLWQRNSTLNLTTLLALVLRVLRTAFGFIF